MDVNTQAATRGQGRGLFTASRTGVSIFGKILKYIFLLALTVITVYPFLWMIFSSFKTDGMIMATPASLFVANPTFDAYKKIWERLPFLIFFKNSVIFSAGVTICVLLFDTMAAYAFARLKFKGKNFLFLLIVSTLMIPFQVVMVPLFVELNKLRLLDTYLGLILPRAADAFGIFLMRGFFITLPRDLEEAARIDGCNEFQIFRKIILPLCMTAFLSLGLFVFNGNWGDLLYPMLLTSKTSMRTLQAGIALMMANVQGNAQGEYSLMLAGSFLSVLPILVAYIFLQKYFIQGIAMTGIKE